MHPVIAYVFPARDGSAPTYWSNILSGMAAIVARGSTTGDVMGFGVFHNCFRSAPVLDMSEVYDEMVAALQSDPDIDEVRLSHTVRLIRQKAER